MEARLKDIQPSDSLDLLPAVLDYCREHTGELSVDWFSMRRHERSLIDGLELEFGEEALADLVSSYPREIRDAAFPHAWQRPMTHVQALEAARQFGFTHAFNLLTKVARPIHLLVALVRDLDAAGLLNESVLWRFDPWTGTVRAGEAKFEYRCFVRK